MLISGYPAMVTDIDNQIEQVKAQIGAMNYLLAQYQKSPSFMVYIAGGSPMQFLADEVGAGIIAGVQSRIGKLQKELDGLTKNKDAAIDPQLYAQLIAAWNAANTGARNQFLGVIGATLTPKPAAG